MSHGSIREFGFDAVRHHWNTLTSTIATKMPPREVKAEFLVEIAKMKGETDEDTLRLRKDLQTAESFLTDHKKWCNGIVERYFGDGVGGIVTAFLFKIVVKHEGVDDWLWVVTGDTPPVHMVVDDIPTPLDAMFVYCDLMESWADAAFSTGNVDNEFPLCAPPTSANANSLKGRIADIRKDVLPYIEARRFAK
jgi:hypothetical protein